MQGSNFFVLVTSAAHKVPLVHAVQAAVRKLPEIAGVVAGDVNECALTRYIADKFWLMPPTSDEFVEEILQNCKRHQIKVVIPTRDGELQFWARNRTLFELNNIKVLVSPLSSIKLCVDKLVFSEFCEKHGFPCIKTALHLDQLPSVASYVVKERYGAGARSVGIGLGRTDAMQHALGLMAPIFQPQVSGIEISVDGWVDNFGRVRGVVLRSRDLIISGESKVTTTFRSTEIEKVATGIIEALDLRGHVVMQAFIGGGGGLHIIECNARFGGASTASIAVGLDSIYWSLCELLNMTPAIPEFNRLNQEVRQVRVASDIYEYRSRF
jgi:carbamoyl-phosphate synthase large subunit